MLKSPKYLVKVLLLIGLIGLLSFSCTKSDTGVVLQGISFKDNTVTMTTGASMQLNPVFEPAIFDGIPVEWVSSNPTVVTVIEGGKIFALNHGTAWITIQDKNSATSGKCLVTVQ